MGRSYDGIEFGAPDGKPTYLFFLLGLTHDRLHLPILGRLARLMMRNPAMIGKLRATTSPTTMRATLLKMDAEAISASAGNAVEYDKVAQAGSSPQLDRGVRLRAIMRLTAQRKQERKKGEAAAAANKRKRKSGSGRNPKTPRKG
jgi:hypothetical protein